MSPTPPSTLPRRIREYLDRCLPERPAEHSRARLRQQGEIRLGPAKPWIPFTAEQSISSREVEFLWRAKFKMARFIPGVVEDGFSQGRGWLDARLLGFVRVAHAEGPKVDRGEAQRYLAEIAWCPLALVSNESLRFEELSEDCVRISAFDDDTYVDLTFDESSEIRSVRSLTRYRDAETQPWEGRFWDYRSFGDTRLPTFAEVWWDGPEGRFVYWRGNVTDFEWVPVTDAPTLSNPGTPSSSGNASMV